MLQCAGFSLLGHLFSQWVLDQELTRNSNGLNLPLLCSCPFLVADISCTLIGCPRDAIPALWVKPPNLGVIFILKCVSCFPCSGWFSRFEGAELSLLCHLQTTSPVRLWKAASGCVWRLMGEQLCMWGALRPPETSLSTFPSASVGRRGCLSQSCQDNNPHL